ncbi:sulfotransferase [Litorisediminicola beolgyonensis]|uniref:Sulfotransferase n=1 Tax=Litorisediminicola beolgyonensis TaxID=1173614 RepID=A0ABW3ZJY5_9RHOB
MSRLRVINLGLPKSGTTTFARALKRAGLAVADWKIQPGQSSDAGLQDRFLGELLYDGYFKHGDPLALLPEFDAFAEISTASKSFSLWPQLDFPLIQCIRDRHPGAKFVLSHRPAEEIVDSMMRWSNLGSRRLPKYSIPGLPAGYGKTTSELERWVTGHYLFTRHAFADSADFLEYDIADPDAPRQLEAFLGISIPWWGKANANPSVPKDQTAEGAAETDDSAAKAGTTETTE